MLTRFIIINDNKLHIDIQSGEKKSQSLNRFSNIYIYQNTPYYISNETQLDKLHDGEKCIVKYFTINIVYFFENNLQKTRVTKGVIFKEKAEIRFCLNM